MKIKITILYLLLSANLLFAQKSELRIMIANTLMYLDKAETAIDNCDNLLKDCLQTQSADLQKKFLQDAIKAALKAKDQSDLAENIADKAEIAAKKIGCFTTAVGTDDAEDYCRQLGYHTYEISIYAKKSSSELELVYIQEYIYKAQGYSKQAFESIKNATAELKDALKDLDSCE